VDALTRDEPALLAGRAAYWPLHVAAQRGRTAIARLLLGRGADPDAVSYYGPESAYSHVMRPLHWAAQHGHTETARLLVAHGADVEGGNALYTPLACAARSRHEETAAVLRACGAQEHVLIAVAFGRTAAVESLLGADPSLVHAADEMGTTALHVAAEQWHLDLLGLLVRRGADVRAVDKHHWTAMHYAAHYWRWEGAGNEAAVREEARQEAVAELLVQAGAPFDVGDWHGVTPLHRACRFYYPGIVRVLLRHGATVDAKDVAGQTPLRRAAKHPDRLALARLLLERGADPTVRDKKGFTVLQAAQGAAMKALLRAHGAVE